MIDKLFNNQELSDITLIVSSGDVIETLYLNKCILGSNSEFFNSLLFGPMANNSSQIAITFDDPKIFVEVVKYVYGLYPIGSIHFNFEEVMMWNKCIDQFLFVELKAVSEQMIIDYLPGLNQEKWISLLVFAHETDNKKLYDKAVVYVKNHWSPEIAELLLDYPRILIDIINMFIVCEEE